MEVNDMLESTRVKREDALLCPSSRVGMPESSVFAIVDQRASTATIHYLRRPVAITAEVLAMADGENPNSVFRVSSLCQRNQCNHFQGGKCGLPELLQNSLPADAAKSAACAIRSSCRWFHQLSFEACSRCASVVTAQYELIDGKLHGRLEPSVPQALSSIQSTNIVEDGS
jgi:hypothetical protein